MKKLLLLLLLPIFSFGQINTFPWINNFESFIDLEQDQNDDGDWWLNQGPTSSFNTGPSGDHTTGFGIYSYVESSYPNYPNKQFVCYTPEFDISATPGRMLSFWYHMYGIGMGELEIAAIDNMGNYIFIDAIFGNQGDQWHFTHYQLDSFNIQNNFKIAFIATTGTGFTSDFAIDDIMVSNPFPVIYGCTDTICSNYDSVATINDGSCIYIFGCMDNNADNYNPWANVDDGTCAQQVVCTPGLSLIDVAITLDNWPSETSWMLYSATDTFALVNSGTYDYTQTGQTVHTQTCVPVGDTILFAIYDTYGDGIGGGSVVGNCVVTNISCGEVIYDLSTQNFPAPSNFGYDDYSLPYVSPSCSDTVIFGCTNPSYIEYDSLATDDDGSCMTLATYGCIDPAAFNYDPTADKMLLTSPCTYNLILYDAGGDSWGNCWLGVEQADSLWQFKIDNNGVYSDTFALTLNSNDEVYFYYFEIPTAQQNPQQLDIQTIQNSFKLENDYGTIIHEGDNPWPGPNENKLRNYRTANDIYSAMPYCGNECIPVVDGCMDAIAYNYNSLANTNDTCYYDPGCTNPGYLEYYTQGYIADVNDSSCSVLAMFGCMDSTAFNYDSTANVDNGGCIPVIIGCMLDGAFNYNPNANTPDTCIPIIYGCTSPIALNYDSLANTDDGSCIGIVYGCTDPNAFNFNPLANVDDSSCVPVVYGCTDPIMFNYNVLANVDNGSCEPYVYGCTDSIMFNYDPLANSDNNSCIPFIYGCTDPSMLNYNAQANTEDFSCIAYVYGCMDSTALNFDSLANTDNGSCVEIIMGCMDPDAYNYESIANVNDSISCLYNAGCITGAGNPYWLNDPCYAWVLSVDDYCCENEWDSICQLTYNYCDSSWTGPIPTREGLDNYIVIYPNPTKDKVNINKNVDINVYNYIGDMVISKRNINVLDMSKMNSGVYMLQIKYKNKIITKQLIKK